MPYVKQNFQTGQKLRAEHLNHMEVGIQDMDTRLDTLEQKNDEPTGLSDTEKNLMLTLFAGAVYANASMKETYDKLKTVWGGGSVPDVPTPDVPEDVPVTSVSISKNILTLTEGESETLTAVVLPADATDKTVTWSVSPDGYATVTGGVVTAVKEGTCLVTAKAGNCTASCAVTVKARANIGPVDGVDAVYALSEEKQFLPENKEYIDTGVKLFEDISAGKTWTILIDADDFGRLKNLSTSPVMFHCGDTEDNGFMSVMAWTNGAVVFDLYGVQNRLGWWGGSTSARLHQYLQIKGTQYRMGSDPANDAWADITNCTKNIATTLLLGAWRNDDGSIDRYWDGTIKQFAVYDKLLTDAQIKTFVEAD